MLTREWVVKSVVLLDPMVEDTVRTAIHYNDGGSYLAWSLNFAKLSNRWSVYDARRTNGNKPVVLTSRVIRRYFRKLIECELPEISVLSFEEFQAKCLFSLWGKFQSKL